MLKIDAMEEDKLIDRYNLRRQYYSLYQYQSLYEISFHILYH